MRMMAFTLLLGWAAVGCGNDESAGSPDLARCIEGWWQDPAPSACACPGAVECDASDCESRRVVAFMPDGVSFNGVVRVSPSAHTATPSGVIARATYSVEAGEVRMTSSGTQAYTAAVSCQAAELVFNHVIKMRAPDWLAADLTETVQQGGK